MTFPESGGFLVRYKPTSRTLGWTHHHPNWGLQVGAVYRVLSINDGQYLCFYEGDTGSHFTNFEAVENGFGGTVSEVIPWPKAPDPEDRAAEPFGVSRGRFDSFRTPEAHTGPGSASPATPVLHRSHDSF